MKDIKKIYNDSIICDLTLPWVPEAENKKKILERYYNNKFNFVSLSVGVERMNTEQTIKYIKKVITSNIERIIIIACTIGISSCHNPRTIAKSS